GDHPAPVPPGRHQTRLPDLTLSLFPRYDRLEDEQGKNGVVSALLIFPVTLKGDGFTDVAGRRGESSGVLNDYPSIVRPGSDLGDHAKRPAPRGARAADRR